MMEQGFSTPNRKWSVLMRVFLALALAASLIPLDNARAGTVTVNTLDDENDGSCSDGDCSLRDAIATAFPGDVINFSVTGTILITGGYLSITKNLTITGPGASNLILDGGDSTRIMSVSSSVTNLVISGITFHQGYDPNGGALHNSGTVEINNSVFSENNGSYGGAIYNSEGAILTLINTQIINNDSTHRGGGIINRGVTASLTLEDCTVSGNSTVYIGGGIFNRWGDAEINNSTISGNSSSDGGGISNHDGDLIIINSTISGNTATGWGGGVDNRDGSIDNIGITYLYYTTITGNTGGHGGGVHTYIGYSGQSKIYFYSSIVAGNTQTGGSGQEDCGISGGSLISNDYNLTGSGTGCGLGGTNDLTTSMPGLLPLADHGGGTDTHALRSGSPAINHIPAGANHCGISFGEDQRGLPRPGDGKCDIGAFEAQGAHNNPGFYVPSGGKWYLKNDQENGWANFVSVKFAGPSGALAVSGDWDDDGVDTPGFYVPSAGKWYLKNDQVSGWSNFVTVKFAGVSGSLPVAGDWNSDGTDTIGFYVPSGGKWYLKDDLVNGWNNFSTVKFAGPSGALPVVGDWNSNNYDTIGFYVPSGGKWYLKNDTVNGWNNYVTVKYPGPSGAQALGGDWDADGTDTIGFYVPSGGKWYLKNDQLNGWNNFVTIKFPGPSGSQSLGGDWK